MKINSIFTEWKKSYKYFLNIDDYAVAVLSIRFYDNMSTYLSDLFVQNPYRNKGAGQALINKCIEISKSYDRTRINLHVYTDNTSAISFYKKMGFKIILTTDKQQYYMSKELT